MPVANCEFKKLKLGSLFNLIRLGVKIFSPLWYPYWGDRCKCNLVDSQKGYDTMMYYIQLVVLYAQEKLRFMSKRLRLIKKEKAGGMSPTIYTGKN